MLQYKTVALPSTTFDEATKYDFLYGLTLDTATKSVSLIGDLIQTEATEGWTFHSIESMPKHIRRKKTVFELIFGWIPFLNRFLCPRISEATVGADFHLYCMVFVKEV